MSSNTDSRGRLADLAAASWLFLVILGIVGSAVALAYRLPISGTVSASTVVTHLLYPLAIAIAAILVLGTYVAMRELYGRSTTDGAIKKIVQIIKEAGAADELRQQATRPDGGDRDDGN